MKISKSSNGPEFRPKNAQATATMETMPSAAAKPSEIYGVHQIGGEVIFATLCPGAATVQVGGNFNNWQPEKSPMKKIGGAGAWQLKLRLSPGTYRYRLVIDGKWQQDPCNNNVEPNPYGELNSVLTVK